MILSRATSLEGFLALRLPTPAELNARPPQYLLDEINRLLQLEKTTTKELHRYLQDLACPVPQAVLDLFAPDTEEKEAQEVSLARKRRLDTTPTVGKRIRGKTTMPATDPRNAPCTAQSTSLQVAASAPQSTAQEPQVTE